MFFTAFALSVVVIIVILFWVRSTQRKKISQKELEEEREKGIID